MKENIPPSLATATVPVQKPTPSQISAPTVLQVTEVPLQLALSSWLQDPCYLPQVLPAHTNVYIHAHATHLTPLPPFTPMYYMPPPPIPFSSPDWMPPAPYFFQHPVSPTKQSVSLDEQLDANPKCP
jgi:hypothetical protein